MPDWRQKQANFDQLPNFVKTISLATFNLNQSVNRLNDNVSSLEADVNVIVMLISRLEQCVQEQTKMLREVRDVMNDSFGGKNGT